MSQSYVALSELKTWLGVTGSAQDTNLTIAIKAASSSIADYCGRQFDIDSSVVTRVYDCEFMDYVEVDDIATVTGLIVKTLEADGTVNETLTLNTDYYLSPYNSDKTDPAKPFTKIIMAIEKAGKLLPTQHRQGLSVTAKFGFSAIPDTIYQAALIQSARFWQRKNSPMGFSGNPETGNATVIFLSELDPDVKNLCKSFKKTTVTLASGRPYVGLTAINVNRQYGL
mgnify:CR=1 FL=1|tara:strand:- start:314 stop:991 length:678 start_codon:yes stop_codon:yes gene_type:complete